MLRIDDYRALTALPIGAVVLAESGDVFVRSHPAYWTATTPRPRSVTSRDVAGELPGVLLHPPAYTSEHFEVLGEYVAEMFDVEVANPEEVGAAIVSLEHDIVATLEPARPETWWDRLVARLTHWFRPPQPLEELQALADATIIDMQLRSALETGATATADQLHAQLRDMIDQFDVPE